MRKGCVCIVDGQPWVISYVTHGADELPLGEQDADPESGGQCTTFVFEIPGDIRAPWEENELEKAFLAANPPRRFLYEEWRAFR